MCLAYKAHNSTAPVYLSNLVQWQQHARSLGLAQIKHRWFNVDCPANKETVWWSGIFSMGAETLELSTLSSPEQYIPCNYKTFRKAMKTYLFS